VERRQAEEVKAKVCPFPDVPLLPLTTAQVGVRKAARLKKKAGRTKKINH
jgi:hypothetical protein